MMMTNQSIYLEVRVVPLVDEELAVRDCSLFAHGVKHVAKWHQQLVAPQL
jgi:hypothetical protein